MSNIYGYANDTLTTGDYVKIYTCPTNTQTVITGATASNVGSTARLVTASIVRDSGSVAPTGANEVLVKHPVQLEADAFLDKLAGKHLNAGDTVWMKLDESGTVNVFLDVREFV